MFGHIKDRIDHLQIAQADVATLPGQAVFDGSEVFGRDLHVGDFLAQSSPSPLVLTRPNWVRADARGQVTAGPEGKAAMPAITPDQAEIARLRAQVARLTIERDIAKKAAAYFAQDVLQGTPGFSG